MLKPEKIEDKSAKVAVTEINNQTIKLYFATINSDKFWKTATLFAENGELHPPFESPLVGQKNIANYLEKEAPGMKLIPKQWTEKATEYQVIGTVQTPLFSVNVQWNFVLNGHGEIDSVKIKLLAKLEELLILKDARTQYSKLNP